MSRLPSLDQAVFNYEEKKKEVEFYKNELAIAQQQARINYTTEIRSYVHYLESLMRTLKNEMLSAELTVAEVQWYGEEAAV